MTESFSTLLTRFYRWMRLSPWRAAAILVLLIIIISLVTYGIRVILQENRSLAVLNWLNLLLIPLLLGAAALWLTNSWRQTQLDIARLRDERAMIEGYFDRLTDLLLNKNLRQSNSDDETVRAARAHTLTTLRNLNPDDRGQVVRFLYESALLNAAEPIIDLQAADLSKMDLSLSLIHI